MLEYSQKVPSIGMTVHVALTAVMPSRVLGFLRVEVSHPFQHIACVSLNPVKDKDSGAWELEPFCFPCFYFVELSQCLSAFLMPNTHSPTTILGRLFKQGVGRPVSLTPTFFPKSPSIR